MSYAHLIAQDEVLEIGPGKGAITQEILKTTQHLTVIEKDFELYSLLKSQFTQHPHLLIKHQDIMDFDFDSLASKKIKVISNLPFQLTSPILGLFLPQTAKVDSCLFIMQKELADRIAAPSGTKLFSHISLFAQFYSDVEKVLEVSRQLFYPPPKIDCAGVFFKLKKPPLDKAAEFFEMTQQAFNHKRKMLRGSLPFDSNQVEIALESIGKKKTARPEELGVQDWVKLHKILSPLNR